MKRKLSNVTLLGIDCVNVERLQAAMDVSEKDFEFGAVKLLTSLPTNDPRLVKIPHIAPIEDFSRFCIEDLHTYVDTEFVLLVQHDGFILNPDSWTDEFLKYDYIGAPWLVAGWFVRDFAISKSAPGERIVGNGSFCIRSRKFLEISARLAQEGKIPKMHPEDIALCVWNKDLLEKEGIRFAPPELAAKFSIEGEDWIYEKQFGFHGFSWTNIDQWIMEHPEYVLIVDAYKKARISRFHRLLIRARDRALSDAQKVFQDKAIEAHVFGSVARRDSDSYSDLDVWFTFKDEDIKEVLSKRLEYYSQVGEIIHVCEAPQNAPVDGVHSSVIHKNPAGLLLQVDYYLCPQSTAFQIEGSKKIFGEIELPQKEFGYNPQKIVVDAAYRIDFVMMFTFTSIKYLIRKEADALDNLFKEYGYLSERYGISTSPLPAKENTFAVLREVIVNLKKVSNDRQKQALSEIEDFSVTVEETEKTELHN